MESPFVIAGLVFLGIFFMFFFISLLSDLVIVGVAVGSAVLAYNIPQFYPEFRDILNDLPFLHQVGLVLPHQADVQAYYMIAVLIILVGTLLCIPVLPFSATYRHMLGAQRISSRDEARIRDMIYAEVADEFRRREKTHSKEAVAYEKEDEPPPPVPVVKKRPMVAKPVPKPRKPVPAHPAPQKIQDKTL